MRKVGSDLVWGDQHWCFVQMGNAHRARRLVPGLAVHLHRNGLVDPEFQNDFLALANLVDVCHSNLQLSLENYE